MSTFLRFSPLLLALLLQAPKTEPGFTSLFNGKDFTGWKLVNPASFKIEDGAIVANGTAGHAFYDGEFRNHMFRNFELKVDVMTRANSNGGVYVLTEFQEAGFPKQGIRGPGEQHLRPRSREVRQPLPRAGRHRSARQRRRVVHGTHHRPGGHHHHQREQ